MKENNEAVCGNICGELLPRVSDGMLESLKILFIDLVIQVHRRKTAGINPRLTNDIAVR